MEREKIFYSQTNVHSFDGKRDYLDISGKLHHFLGTNHFGMKTCFRLKSSGYCTLLAVYYKESLLPDFSVNVNKGYLTITTKNKGRLLVVSDTTACNDGAAHELILNGDEKGLYGWLDGRPAISLPDVVPYCGFDYVGFVTVGRGTLQNQYNSFWEGDIYSMELSAEPFERSEEKSALPVIKKQVLFERGMSGVVNYRIPSVITTKTGVVIASADARMDAPGDNPNHICRAVRRSHDSGETWEEVVLSADFGGVGREDGAAAVDGQLVLDELTGTVFMLYGHTRGAVGSLLSKPETGFDNKGRRILKDKEDRVFFQEIDGRVVAADGSGTGYRVDGYDRLYFGEREAGSVCHGADAPFKIEPTSFLQMVESHDDGKTWSEPIELNPQVKMPWMCFLGPGPGIGICVKNGIYKGRLVCPVYYSNEQGLYSNGTIYSDDHGKNWTLGVSVNNGRILDGEAINAAKSKKHDAVLGESQLIELEDGCLKFFIRNPMFPHIITAVSRDGGVNWENIKEEEQLMNPDCQCAVLKVPGGYLYSGSAHSNLRVQGTVYFSQDGETWNRGSLLESGEFAYSCMTGLPDGQIGILYEGLNISLYFAKFPMEWVK